MEEFKLPDDLVAEIIEMLTDAVGADRIAEFRLGRAYGVPLYFRCVRHWDRHDD